MLKLIIKMNHGAVAEKICNDQDELDEYKEYIRINNNWGKEGEYTLEQVDISQEIAKEKIKKLFSGIRELWQNLSDEFAANNAALGITSAGKTKEVADKFNGVIYYLNCNAPMEAIRELNLIVTDSVYVTPTVITNMSNALLGYIQDNK